ncbi:MAG: chemotaxis protein CheA [Deltaproteobacteria bacterium]|nr:chemotaxis protein CheA [Deltaproteobacteria bacterium]
MIQDAAQLNQEIDQLAMNVISVEPEDIMVLGSILQQLEKIEKITDPPSLKPIQGFCIPLKKGIEKLLLNECLSPPKALETISNGIRIIQGKISYGDLSQILPEENAFWEEMEALIGPINPVVLPLEKEESPGGQPPAETSSDIAQDLELFNDFVSEAMEHLESIEVNLINLEQAPDDKECINAIFRPFHTIKGVAGFLNLQGIHKFSHAVESLLDDARNDQIAVNRQIIDTILEAVDFLKTMILEEKEAVESGKTRSKPVDLGPWLDRLGSLRESSSIGSGKVLEEIPESKVPPLGEILAAKGVVSGEALDQALKSQVGEKHDQKIGEILILEQKAKPKEVLEGLRDQKRLSGQGADATVKVDTKKLDNLVDMVGELVIAQSLVQQNPVLDSISDQKLSRDLSQLKRITSDLQKISMSLRMVPIRHTFQKMIRLVRDLSKKSGKQVELRLSGEETEIDRNMVDTLYDPLVHMIRNSADHGIELPQKRLDIGKPESGQVFLRAYQKGGNIVIEIEDDGQGLNRNRIIAKAKERKIISDDNALTEFQIDNLIFEPGFSTAEKITDVSGRGVGMDVVRKVIEKLRGKVEIYSTEGKGCRFVIRVPLTLAIMDGILVKIGKERFIIPTVTIKETLRPAPEDVFTVGKKEEMVKVRNSLLPLVRLNTLLNIFSEEKKPWEGLVVVVENDGIQKGLMVDDLLGKQEVVIKNLGEKLKAVKGVAGGAILGDGQISLILDVNGIFEIYRGKND